MHHLNAMHWAQPFVHDAIVSMTPLTRGLQHQNELLCLQDGSLWVAKRFAPSTWLGETQPAQLELAEQLAATVATRLQLTHTALQSPSSAYVIAMGEHLGLIKPYCSGVLLDRLSIQQAHSLGEALAQIHQLGFQHPNAQPFPAIQCQFDAATPAWLPLLVHDCNQRRHYRADEWVVSHRDLHHHNLIWPTPHQLHILDWESVGLIHPFVELLGLALNCAGVVEHHFQASLFKATLNGYLAKASRLPHADNPLWQLSFHSWLLWYAYCQRQGNEQGVAANWATLHYLWALLPHLKMIYNEHYHARKS